MGKSIPSYMKLIQEDERFVKKDPNGNFVNVWIRTAELKGRIGSIELESSDQMPVSDDQKADIIMRLMELNNMEVMQSLTSPENLPFIRKIVKIPEFRLAGEDDRQKQYEEINILVNSEPIIIPTDPVLNAQSIQYGLGEIPPTETPSVEIDPLVDNHAIEAEICRTWLISDAGRLAKVENPAGYKNVLLHFKQHMQMMAVTMQQNAQMQQMNNNPKPNGKDPSETQIKENKDVRTPVQ